MVSMKLDKRALKTAFSALWAAIKWEQSFADAWHKGTPEGRKALAQVKKYEKLRGRMAKALLDKPSEK